MDPAPEPAAAAGLLGECQWKAETLVERVRELVVARLGSADAVLALDETAEIKQRSSNATVGVAPPVRRGDRTGGELPRTSSINWRLSIL